MGYSHALPYIDSTINIYFVCLSLGRRRTKVGPNSKDIVAAALTQRYVTGLCVHYSKVVMHFRSVAVPPSVMQESKADDVQEIKRELGSLFYMLDLVIIISAHMLQF